MLIRKKRKPQIWTDFNSFIRRNRKRFLVKQTPKVIWLTGLSGSGKTTLSKSLEEAILKKGYFTKYFDGDVIRAGINKDLGFNEEDRKENIRRIAEIAKIFLDSGIIVICGFITPTEEMRKIAKDIIGRKRFVEVFVNASLEVCERRDVKGLYKKAREGKIKNFTGIDGAFEPPRNPDVEVRTDLWSLKKSTKYLAQQVIPKIRYKNRNIPTG